MTKQEKEKIVEMLNRAVERYLIFRNRDDYPDKPCVRAEASARQNAVFNLSDYLYHYGFITWEQCCECWIKVGILETIENEACAFESCSANINGVCKYTINKQALAEMQKG